MGDLLHDAAIDLLNAGLSVNDDIVKIVAEKIDDFFQIGVDLAVAAGAFRTANGQEGKLLLLYHGVKNAVSRFAQQFDGFAGRSVFYTCNDTFADIIQCFTNLYAQSGTQAHSGVGVNGEDTRIRICFRQQADKCRGNGCFSHTAFAGHSQNLGLPFHSVSHPF